MYITKISLKNFRNIIDTEITLNKNLNIFFGDNGQGKTNFVESVSFLSAMKSFKEEDDKVLINNDEKQFQIDVSFISNSVLHTLGVVVDGRVKKITFDGETNLTSKETIGNLNVVTFNPLDVNIFNESPKTRRRFLDDELSKMSPSYNHSKNDFNQIIKERNEFLKLENKDEVYLMVINHQIAKLNLELMEKRNELIKKLNQYLSQKYKIISFEENVELKIDYVTFLDEENFTLEAIKQKLNESYEEDLRRQATQIGVHRDDFIVYLNNLDIAKYGSQGQKRLSAIAIKLALIEIIKERNKDDSIIVLDDVLSELDATKQKALITYLNKQNQILLTTAHIEEIEKTLSGYECDYWHVENGIIKKRGMENGW